MNSSGFLSNESKGGGGGGWMLPGMRQWAVPESSGDSGLAGVAGGRETIGGCCRNLLRAWA